MPFLQDPDAKLTLTRVASAPKLVAEIATLTHQRLEVAPTMGTEILMVSVEDARAKDVLARIAVAATAVWQPIEGGLRLVPDKGAREVEASAERARRLQGLQAELKKRQEAAAKVAAAKPSPTPSPEMTTAMLGMANGVDAFVPLIDLKTLSAMAPGDRVVFATDPNDAQRPLLGDAGPIVQNWIATHNKTAKAASASEGEMPEELSALLKGSLGDQFKRMSQPVTATPAKIVVVASRSATLGFGGMGMDLRLEARAYGSDGKLLIQETGTLGSGMIAFVAAMRTPKAAAPSGPSTPIVYSADAKALIGMSGSNRIASAMSGQAFSRGVKMSDTLRERFFSPDRFEPLALLPGEGLVALAKARRKPLVGCIPDAAFPGVIGDDAPKTLEEVETKLETGSMRLVPDAEYLVVKPTEPDSARRQRLDRGPLTILMGAVADHEAPNLDELADFAAKTPSPSENALSTLFLTTFLPSMMDGMTGMMSWDALRLYAGLAPVQRQTLAGGGRVAFQTLSPLGQTALSAMLYGAPGELRVDRPGAAVADDAISRAISAQLGGGGTDARDEPTEVAPRGLPANGYLQATLSSDTILRPLTADGPSRATLSTEELAVVRMVSSSPMAAQVGDALRLPDTGRMGSRTVWNLRGYVAADAYVGATLTDDRTPKDGETVSLTSLPAKLQAKVADEAEKLKKSPLGAIMAMAALMGKPAAKP